MAMVASRNGSSMEPIWDEQVAQELYDHEVRVVVVGLE